MPCAVSAASSASTAGGGRAPSRGCCRPGAPRARTARAVAARPGRPGPSPADDHRPVRGRRPADGRRRARPGRGLQRLHLQLPASCATSCSGHGYRFFSTSDTEVILKAYHRWGAGCVDHFYGHVRVRPGRARPPAGWCWPATGSASSRSTWPRRPAGCGSPRRCPRCSPAVTSTPSIDPVALHHYMTFHSVVPAAADDPRRRPEAAAGDRPGRSSRTAAAPRPVYWEPAHTRAAGRADAATTGRSRCWTRCAPRSSGGWSPTCRSACCSPAASTPA